MGLYGKGKRSIDVRGLQACPTRHTSLLLPSPVTVSVIVTACITSYDHAGSIALAPDSFSVSNQLESSLSWLWNLFGSRKEKTNSITIPKYPTTKDDITLKVALQYGTATGLPQLQKFLKEFVEKIYQPAYLDWTTLVQTGNTDG